MTRKCQCEEEPCVCSELESFLSEMEETKVRSSALLLSHMFDVGSGESVKTGDHVLTVLLYGKDGPPADGEPIFRMSFQQEAAHKLISTLIMGYSELWGPGNDD